MDKKQLTTIIVVLFTVALAGVAIFTAVRLYQQRNEQVAPTAPTSIPRAAEGDTESCSPLTFDIAGTPQCGDSCDPNNDNSCPEDHTCSSTTNKCVLTACLVSGATCDSNQCNEIEPENPNCGDTCSTDTDCPTDHTCSGGKCVLTLCTQQGRTCTANNCSLAPKCGDTCTTNSECPNDHTCSSGKCVLNDCLQSGATCTANKCSTTTPTTTAPTAAPTTTPSLPDAGTTLPTLVAGVVGLLTIVGALFFAF